MVKSAATTALALASGQSAEHSKTRNPEVRTVLNFFFLLYFPYLENGINNGSVRSMFAEYFCTRYLLQQAIIYMLSHLISIVILKDKYH